MARDIQDTVRTVLGSDSTKALLGTAITEALKSAGSRSNGSKPHDKHQPLSGMRGVAAGAGAAALAPVAAKGIGKLVRGKAVDAVTSAPKRLAEGAGSKLGDAPKRLAEGAGSKLGDTVGDRVSGKIDDAGGPSGILKDTVKSALPFGGGGGGPKGGVPGVGKGRRMPVQQSVDVAVPIETAYNQWTQFEEWPNFMHRVTRVTQEDPCEVSFATKIWGKTKEFTAHIETQRPDERIKWRVTDGMIHTGVVTFHELAPRLTRIELGLDVEPGGLMEKAARGMRHVKRAARADLHRFKAFIEMLEQETGAWRGVIEDGELVEDHDPKYDRNREYRSVEDLIAEREEDQDGDDEDQGGEEEEKRSRSRSSSRNGQGGRSRSSGGQRRSSSSSRGATKQAQSRRSTPSRTRGQNSGSSSGSGRGRSASSNKSSGGSSRSSSSGSSRSRSSSGQRSGGQRTRSRRA